jgi:hypothetical protein
MAVEDGHPDLVFLDLLGGFIPRPAAEKMEQILQPGRSAEMRGSAHAFGQSPHLLFRKQGRLNLGKMHLHQILPFAKAAHKIFHIN